MADREINLPPPSGSPTVANPYPEEHHDDPGLMADVATREPVVIPAEAITVVMRAQTDYITAQENFIHERDLAVLIVAQETFINALATFIRLNGETVLADMQEQFLGVQISALRRLGIL